MVAAFELLLARPPLLGGELEAAQKLPNLRELVDHLIGSDAFRVRYENIGRSRAAQPGGPAAIARLPPVYLGDRVLAATHHGQLMYLMPHDIDLTPGILLNGSWEPHVERTTIRQVRAGSTVIDIGANVGYHTIILGAFVAPGGRVFAFEPHPGLMPLLRANVHVNGLRHVVELSACAVADRSGSITLAWNADHCGSGNVSPGHSTPGFDADYPNRADVPVVTLDGALGDRVSQVDLIHLDIEGAEPLALRGARSLIERSPAVKIVTEWSVGMMSARADVGECVAWLEGMGFRFWLIEHNTANLLPVAPANLLDLPLCDLLLSRGEPE